MPTSDDLVALEGSEWPPLPGAASTGQVPADQPIQVTVYLRPDPAQQAPEGRVLSREELAEVRGASAEDVAAVVQFAGDAGLTVAEVDRPQRRVVVTGNAGAVNAAFGISLEQFSHPDGTYRGHAGPVRVPRGLSDSVVAVLGVDDRRQADTRFRQAAAPQTSYTPVQVAAAYGFPADLDGSGQTIAFIELGGGYNTSDLSTYFSGLKLTTPPVTAVPVDGGSNAPTGDASGPDGEVMLDLEVAGAIANGAKLVVYFAPNTDQGFVDAVSAAVHDTTNRPGVISISWGGAESTYTAANRTAFENALGDAALAGVTVCVAAGDSGSTDGVSDGKNHVDYPAASPQVLACGGTHLTASGSTISSETVWGGASAATDGATGGGVSDNFPLPSWQNGVGVPAPASSGGGRGVPDVAGDADPATGYQVRIDGTNTVVGGTSAVAPLWAALITLANQKAGKLLGLVNPVLYQHFGTLPSLTTGFNDITSGSNGAYSAAAGWDACTGLGSPKAAQVIDTLAGQ